MESCVLFFATSYADHLSVSYRTLRTWIDLLMTPTGVILGELIHKNQPEISFSQSLIITEYITELLTLIFIQNKIFSLEL